MRDNIFYSVMSVVFGRSNQYSVVVLTLYSLYNYRKNTFLRTSKEIVFALNFKGKSKQRFGVGKNRNCMKIS